MGEKSEKNLSSENLALSKNVLKLNRDKMQSPTPKI
jgi:hypothetical protein